MNLLLPLLVLALPQDPVPAAAVAAETETTIWDRLSFYANGRVRAESTFDQPSGKDRHRGRFRFRLGAKYKLMEDVTAEARITSTSGDSNNPHWDFGSGPDGSNGAELALDRFFLKWQTCENFSVEAGKFPHIFQGPPVYSEFVWDDDVHPAGLAATFGPGKHDRRGYDVRGAAYVAVENGNDTDPGMVGLQGNFYLPLGDSTTVTLSSSLSDWFNLDSGTGVPGNQGNTNVMGDFLIWEAFAAASRSGGTFGGSSVFLQAMRNLDEDDSGDDDGFAAGVSVGGSGKAGATQGFLTYYDLEANAVFSPPAQDDTPISGTGIGNGMNGVIVGTRYWIADNFSVRLWALTSDADAADDPTRVRLDFDFSVK